MRSNKKIQEERYGEYLERVTKARKICNSFNKSTVAYALAQRLRALICKYTLAEKNLICDKWLDEPQSFIDWWKTQANIMRYPVLSLRLRRKDIRFPFSPENCFLFLPDILTARHFGPQHAQLQYNRLSELLQWETPGFLPRS